MHRVLGGRIEGRSPHLSRKNAPMHIFFCLRFCSKKSPGRHREGEKRRGRACLRASAERKGPNLNVVDMAEVTTPGSTPAHEGYLLSSSLSVGRHASGSAHTEVDRLSKMHAPKYERGMFAPEALVDVLTGELDSSRRELVLLRSSMAEKEAEYHQVLRALVKEQATRDEEAARRAGDLEAQLRELESRRVPSDSKYYEMERQCAEGEKAMLKMQGMLQQLQLAQQKHNKKPLEDIDAGQSPLEVERRAHRADLLDLAIERSAHAEAIADLEEQLAIERQAYVEDVGILVQLASLPMSQLPQRVQAVLQMEKGPFPAGEGIVNNVSPNGRRASADDDNHSLTSEDDTDDAQTILSSSGHENFSLDSGDSGRTALRTDMGPAHATEKATVTSDCEYKYSLESNENNDRTRTVESREGKDATSTPDAFGKMQSTDDNIRSSLRASQKHPRGTVAVVPTDSMDSIESDKTFIQSTLNTAIEKYYAKKRNQTTPVGASPSAPLRDIVGNLISSLQAVVGDEEALGMAHDTNQGPDPVLAGRTPAWQTVRSTPTEDRPGQTPVVGSAEPTVISEIVCSVIQTLELTNRLPRAAPPNAMKSWADGQWTEQGPRAASDGKTGPPIPELDEIVERVIQTLLKDEQSAQKLRERLRAESQSMHRHHNDESRGRAGSRSIDDRCNEVDIPAQREFSHPIDEIMMFPSLASRMSLASNTGRLEADGVQWTYASQEGLETEMPPPIPAHEDLSEDEIDVHNADDAMLGGVVPPPLPLEESAPPSVDGDEGRGDGEALVEASREEADGTPLVDRDQGDEQVDVPSLHVATDIVQERLRVSSILLSQADSINIDVTDIDSSDSEMDDDDETEDAETDMEPALISDHQRETAPLKATGVITTKEDVTAQDADASANRSRKLSLTPPPIPERIRRSLGEKLRKSSIELAKEEESPKLAKPVESSGPDGAKVLIEGNPTANDVIPDKAHQQQDRNGGDEGGGTVANEPMSRARKSTLRLGTALPGIGMVKRPSQIRHTELPILDEKNDANSEPEPIGASEEQPAAQHDGAASARLDQVAEEVEGVTADVDEGALSCPAPLFEPLAEQLTKSRDRIASRANSILSRSSDDKEAEAEEAVGAKEVGGAELLLDGNKRVGGNLGSIREEESDTGGRERESSSRPRRSSKLAVTAPPRRKLGAASKGMMKKFGK